MSEIGSIFELAIWSAAPGTLASLLANYRNIALPRLAAAAQELVAAWTCEFGQLSRLVVLHRLPQAGAPLEQPFLDLGQTASTRQFLRLERGLATAMPCGIVEWRTYTTAPGQRDAYLQRMLAALHIRERYSPNIGVFTPLSGTRDSIVHFWGYPDIAARMLARTASFADPDWAAYLPSVYPLLATLTSEILIPTAFSPLR